MATTKDKTKDKRKSDRVPFKRSVKFGPKSPPELFGYAYDLSEEGIGLYCEETLSVGDRLIIEIMLESEFLTVRGIVRWFYSGMFGEANKLGVQIVGYPPQLQRIYRRIKITKSANY